VIFHVVIDYPRAERLAMIDNYRMITHALV